MEFEKFKKEFLSYLQKNDKKCLKIIDKNEQIIESSLGENGNYETLKGFIDAVNDALIIQSKFTLFENVFNHPSFRRVYRLWKDSDALIRACQKRNKKACKWILSMDINPYIQDENGMTALMHAVKTVTLISIVRELVTRKDGLDILDKDGNNALFHSLGSSSEIICLLLKTQINVNNMNKKDETVLLYCCKNNIYEPIKYLVTSKDINVNISDREGKTPAMYLAEKGIVADFKSLERRNCNYNYINKKGESVLSILTHNLYQPNNDLIYLASNYIRMITFLSCMNYNFNIPIDDDGNTPIMYYMLLNDFQSLNFILSNTENIDLSIKNNYGESASSLALKLKNKVFLIRLLREPTFDYEYIEPIYNNTILMLAAMAKPSLIKEIIENNVNMTNALNKRNENALILATKANQIKSVAKLLQHYINVNQQDDFGNTSLYYAVDSNNPIIIRLLLSYHADIDIKNGQGKSALDLAQEKGDKSILNILYNPVPVSEDELREEKEHEASYHYNEIYEYLGIYIRHFDTTYRLSEAVENKMKIIYTDVQIRRNNPIYYNNFVDKN